VLTEVVDVKGGDTRVEVDLGGSGKSVGVKRRRAVSLRWSIGSRKEARRERKEEGNALSLTLRTSTSRLLTTILLSLISDLLKGIEEGIGLGIELGDDRCMWISPLILSRTKKSKGRKEEEGEAHWNEMTWESVPASKEDSSLGMEDPLGGRS